MFEVSDKVVCVDDSPGRATGLKELTKGVVYVVCGVQECPHGYSFSSGAGLRLTGVPDFGLYWDSRRFRKLSEIKAENAERAKASRKATLPDYEAVTRAMLRVMLNEDNFR